MIKKLFSHSLIYGIAPQIPKIASVFVLPIITPYLTKLDFGIYGLLTAVTASIAVFSSLGLNVVLNNSFYKSPLQYKWAWRQIYGFLIIWNIIYSFLLGTIIWYFVPIEAVSNVWGIVALNVIPTVFFGPTSVICAMYYRLNLQPTQTVFRSVIIGFLTMGLNVYFIAYQNMGYMGWFLSAGIGQMLLQISYWFPLNRQLKITPIFNFKWRFIKRQLLISLPTVPHFYSNYLLNTSDRLVMKLVGIPISHIGLYNASNTIGNFVSLMGTASGQAIGPMLSKAYKDLNESLARSLVFSLQVAFFVATFLCSIWMKEIFQLLIKNKELQSVYPLAIIIVMANNYRPMYFGANARLFYHENTKVLLKVTFIAGIVTFGLNLILMPFYGYEVAVYTLFLGLMYMGYAGYFLKEYKENCKLNYYPIYWFVASLALTILGFIIVEWSLIFKLLSSVIAMLLGFFGLYFINSLEKSYIK